MGQFAKGVVVPDIPMATLLKCMDLPVDIKVRIGIIVSAERTGTERSFQKSERVAVWLKGAK